MSIHDVVAVLCVAGLAACGTAAGERRDATADGADALVNPDDVKPTADAAAVAKIALCKTTFEEAKALLGGAPYRDGVAHGIALRTWKIGVAHRKAEPAALAFKDDVVVDLCFDLPGFARCDFADRCAPH